MKRTTKSIIWIGLALLLGVLIGRWTSGGATSTETTVAAEGTVWTCSMHPQIRQDHPGSCPLCGMDLIPADSGDEDSDLPLDALKMSPTAMQLANVQTAFVGTGDASKDIRLTGKLTLDPRNSFVQTAYSPGRIERFYFGSLGEYVNKGVKIAELFSPDLVDVQRELLLTHQNRENMPGAYEAVREKMKLWKISDNQIDQIIQNGKVEQNFPIYAQQSGYLIEKQISTGDYVESGSPLFTISQFNSLWGVFNVYEKDAGFIKAGMPVTYTLPSMPGKEFTAKIDFVEPVLNAETRTLNARIVIPNPNLDFKPEMLVNAKVQSSVSGTNQLIVPKSAVMWTGKKSVVYVKYSTENHIGFAMRPVILGPALGDSYIIESGLEAGEEIVVQGTFSVDAAAQLANKPSMMNQGHLSEKIDLPHTALSPEQQKMFQPFISKYFDIKDALVNDNFKDAKTSFVSFANQWQQADWNKLPESVITALNAMKNQDFTKPEIIENVKNVEVLRNHFFYDLSNFLITLTKTYHPAQSETIYVQHCPMVNNDKGADWLSKEKEVLNPYYGASMLRCGEVIETLE